jgi:hypothetical protein
MEQRQICISLIAVEKQYILNIISVSNLALDFRYTNRIFSGPYYIVICGLPGSTAFATLSHKRYGFRGKDL